MVSPARQWCLVETETEGVEMTKTMYAAIFDTNLEPLTDCVELEDDAEFAALETQAAELAAQGNQCCIRWCRENDSQVSYWGPKGASLRAYWYA
jgi:hypothetical protein